MKNRSMTVVVGVLAAVLETAERERDALDAQVRQLRSVEANKERFEAQLERLQLAMPDRAELARFIRSIDAIREQTGVRLMSVAPSEPIAVSGVGTIQMGIQIDGDYFDVMDALRRLEDVDAIGRLVVIDSISLTPSGGDAGATGIGPPPVSATLTARMFTGEVEGGAPDAGAPVADTGTDRAGGAAAAAAAAAAAGG